jgi:hypothetical protein
MNYCEYEYRENEITGVVCGDPASNWRKLVEGVAASAKEKRIS